MKAKKSPNYQNYQHFLKFKSLPLSVHKPPAFLLILIGAFLGVSVIPVFGVFVTPKHDQFLTDIAGIIFCSFIFFCLLYLALTIFKKYQEERKRFQQFSQGEKKIGKGFVISKYWHSCPTIAGSVKYYIVFEFKGKKFRQRVSIFAFKKTEVSKNIDVVYNPKTPHLCRIIHKS